MQNVMNQRERKKDCRGGTSRSRLVRQRQHEQKANSKGRANPDALSHHQRERRTAELLLHFWQLLRPFRTQVAWILALLTVGTVLSLILPASTKFLVDFVLTEKRLPHVFAKHLPADRKSLLLLLVLAFVGVAITRCLIQAYGQWHATRITKRVQLHVRRRVFDHAIRLPQHRVNELRAGGLTSILREDGNSAGTLLSGLLFNSWQAVIQIIGSFAVLAFVDYQLLLTAAALLPLVFWSHRTWISRIRPLFRAIRLQRERIDAAAAEVFSGIRTVKAFRRERYEAERFAIENNLMARQQLHAWWWTFAVESAWELMIAVCSAAILIFGGWRVVEGTLSVGDLMMFLFYLLFLLRPLKALAESATQIQNGLSGLDRVMDLLKEKTESDCDGGLRLAECRTTRANLEFRDVTFCYPDAKSPSLIEINLKIESGQTVALVGRSGAGKTTLCNLVSRLFDPASGSILYNGRDLREYQRRSFRSILGSVEQEVFLFHGSIAENIAYGAKDATEAEIQVAAKIANATEFIETLPRGFDTIIGERGVGISGGQRQRLAIARAILADPQLLILDEATSGLDTESERLIQASLSELRRGRTSIVIAHRLSTIAGADLICVMEDGRLTQKGTHNELVSASGKYRSMVEEQIQTPLANAAIRGTKAGADELCRE